jgi:hypothetical protein
MSAFIDEYRGRLGERICRTMGVGVRFIASEPAACAQRGGSEDERGISRMEEPRRGPTASLRLSVDLEGELSAAASRSAQGGEVSKPQLIPRGGDQLALGDIRRALGARIRLGGPPWLAAALGAMQVRASARMSFSALLPRGPTVAETGGSEWETSCGLA